MPNRALCEAVVRQLWPFLDGSVAEENREQIIRHLEGCDGCRSHFDYATAFLAAIARSEPPAGIDVVSLEQRVRRALAAS